MTQRFGDIVQSRFPGNNNENRYQINGYGRDGTATIRMAEILERAQAEAIHLLARPSIERVVIKDRSSNEIIESHSLPAA